GKEGKRESSSHPRPLHVVSSCPQPPRLGDRARLRL
uniref:Uncharacterized protein n=1 Tax=Macaca fascicularis TaxID=9541 RepID=A0A7N9CNQ3_MACFA